MFNDVFRHRLLRKYVVLFGTLFNNIYCNRYDKNNNEVQSFKVPISYGPKEKFLARLEGDPKLENKVGIVLPRISFYMTSFNFDSSRRLNQLNKIVSQVGSTTSYSYQPVPYDITFELAIMIKNVEDGTFIVEQILPYFAPNFTLTATLIPEISATYDIPISISSVNLLDTYEGSFEQRRAIVWTLQFTMKAWFFGPVKSATLIKDISTVNIKDSSGQSITNTAVSNTVSIVVRPGLTSNGQPTSNSQESISFTLINPNDNYGFIEDITENI